MFGLEAKKHLLINAVGVFVSCVFLVLISSCSSSQSEDWPKMAADTLWQDLEQKRTSSPSDEDVTENADDNVSLSPPSDGVAKIPAIDMTVIMDEVDRDLPVYRENMARALDRYENSDDENKDLHWRGVEIEISRLNDVLGRLRTIEHQLDLYKNSEDLLIRVNELLDQVGALIPTR